MYSPNVYLNLKNGYIFFGLANTNGTVPQPLLHDPSLHFAPVAITSFILARFSDGPMGPGDLVKPTILGHVSHIFPCRLYYFLDAAIFYKK